jgi:diacylglycerol kinase (ATP)
VATPISNRPLRRVVLIFNPFAGRVGGRSLRHFSEVSALFRASAVEVIEVVLGPAAAAEGLREAVTKGCDAVIACGGDGTLNYALREVLPITDEVAFATVPLGSGNLFAKSHNLPAHPLRAAKALLNGTRAHATLGVIANSAAAEYLWAAAAGIGADARVICGINPRLKAHFGILAYYLEAARQLCDPRLSLPWFTIEFTTATGERRRESVTQLVAERIAYFGSTNGGARTLADDELRLVLIKSDRRSAFLNYGASLLASRSSLRLRPGDAVEAVIASEVRCLPAEGPSSTSILAEADGEMVGSIPVRLYTLPRACTIIRPPESIA